jgi:HEAT repeat protein
MRLMEHHEISAYIDELKARNVTLPELSREARRLRRRGPEVWSVLERKVRSEEADLAHFAMILAAQIDAEQTIDLLHEVLLDEHVRDPVKMHAAFTLAELGDPVDLEYLAGVVDDPEAAVAETTEEMFHLLDDPSGLEVFFQSLQEIPLEARSGIIQALGLKGDERAIDALTLLLERGEPELIPAVVEALGNIPSERSLAPLERVAEESLEEATRRLAQKALMKLRTTQVEGRLQPARPPDGRFVNGYLSSAGSEGSWFIVVLVEYPRHGLRSAAFCVNEERGLMDCFGGEYDQDVLDHLRQVSSGGVALFVEAPAWYCREAVREAVVWTDREALPWEYFVYRKVLESLLDQTENEPDRARFEAVWNSGAASPPADLEACAELLERPEFESWRWGLDALEEAFHDVIDCFAEYGSRAHPGYAAEMEEIVTEVLEEEFDAAMNQVLQRRLRHQAYVEWRAGDARAAHLLAATAYSLATGTPVPEDHPFLRAYTQRSLEMPILLYEAAPQSWWEEMEEPPTRSEWWARRRSRRR